MKQFLFLREYYLLSDILIGHSLDERVGGIYCQVGGQQSGARGFMFFIINVDRLGKHSGGWPVVGSKRIYVLYCQC